MKMTRQARKLAILLMTVTMSLAGLTAGYGLWQDTIDIDVVMTSAVGNICFGFTQAIPLDPVAPAGFANADWTCTSDPNDDESCVNTIHHLGSDLSTYPNEIPKDVGSCRVDKLEAQTQCSGTCYRRLKITIDNAYPSYAADFGIKMRNCGGSNIEVTDEIVFSNQAGHYYEVRSNLTSKKCGWLKRIERVKDDDPNRPANDPDDPAVLDICWINFEGEILAHEDLASAELVVHVLQPAEQNFMYQFFVDVEVYA